ncbi:MAG: hypothetical protein R3Y13_02755 [bacterium]
MESREFINKDDTLTRSSRLEKNKNLYDKISNTNIDDFNISSNTSVIDNSETATIDVERIKRILDTKYNEVPKRKSIKIEEEVIQVKELEQTKEYDINAILDKAKSENVVTYEEDKVKKSVDSHYEILKNLDIAEDPEELADEVEVLSNTSVVAEEPEELLDLINTIVIHENKIKEEYTNVALDLFEDLKSDEGDTDLTDPINLVTEPAPRKLDETIKIEAINIAEELNKNDIKAIADKMYEKKDEPVKSSSSQEFDSSDFEELFDQDELKVSIWLKLFIFIIILGFIGGMYLFLTTFMSM